MAVLIPYVVDAVVVLTVMRVLLFVWDISVLISIECERNANVDVGGLGICGCGESGCASMGGTRGSSIVSSANDVI